MGLIGSDSTVGLFDSTFAAINDDFKLNVDAGTTSANGATDEAVRATWINGSVTLLIILLSAITGILLTREISPRLALAS